MGYMIAMGPCCICRQVFSFNPELVPSIRINGEREPVCRSCMEQGNAIRREKGLQPFAILPGAYEPEEVA